MSTERARAACRNTYRLASRSPCHATSRGTLRRPPNIISVSGRQSIVRSSSARARPRPAVERGRPERQATVAEIVFDRAPGLAPCATRVHNVVHHVSLRRDIIPRPVASHAESPRTADQCDSARHDQAPLARRTRGSRAYAHARHASTVALASGRVTIPGEAWVIGDVPCKWYGTRAGDEWHPALPAWRRLVSAPAEPLSPLRDAARALTGLRVLLPDYRLAPEHPFPAAVDDCFAVYRGLVQRLRAGRPFYVAGDSAGGSLTAVTLMRARDDGLPLPEAAVLLSPSTDITMSGASHDYNERLDPMFSRWRRGCCRTSIARARSATTRGFRRCSATGAVCRRSCSTPARRRCCSTTRSARTIAHARPVSMPGCVSGAACRTCSSCSAGCPRPGSRWTISRPSCASTVLRTCSRRGYNGAGGTTSSAIPDSYARSGA